MAQHVYHRITLTLFIFIYCSLHSAQGYYVYSERHGRIIGGDTVKIEDAPFNVALEIDKHHVCGGAVVSERWVITAAHCFGLRFNISRAIIRSGTGERGQGGIEHQVVKALKHPEFIYFKADNDVGLLEVNPPFKYSTVVQPVALPETGVRPQDEDLTTVYGWGYTKETGEPSVNLRGVVLPIYPYEDCVSIYNTSIRITSKMLCAGYKDGGRDACVFDSGGPLVWHKVLHGLVSWGWGCARAFRPGVYTALSDPVVKNWILQVITENDENAANIHLPHTAQILLRREFGIKVDRSLLNSKLKRHFN